MKKLRVFRVQPKSYDRVIQSVGATKNVSAPIRRLIEEACLAPPSEFPVRAKKAELCSFSLFMDDGSHSTLVRASKVAGVSKNLFLEAVFNRVGPAKGTPTSA
jgi:hypothetical protein